MDPADAHASKFLSLLLRHDPGAIGLTLSSDGWAQIRDLVKLTEHRDPPLTRELIERVVRENDKQRFVLSADGEQIRAHQGHSIPVALDLAAQVPPDVLFHGTASRFLDAILKEGLRKGQRQHVHLSADIDTARSVGQRHGSPRILRVAAAAMHAAGTHFYRTENGVWLTDHVPAHALILDADEPPDR